MIETQKEGLIKIIEGNDNTLKYFYKNLNDFDKSYYWLVSFIYIYNIL